ncbi:hypothetical protein ACSSS7_005414 [Eimeria intestinalis]
MACPARQHLKVKQRVSLPARDTPDRVSASLSLERHLGAETPAAAEKQEAAAAAGQRPQSSLVLKKRYGGIAAEERRHLETETGEGDALELYEKQPPQGRGPLQADAHKGTDEGTDEETEGDRCDAAAGAAAGGWGSVVSSSRATGLQAAAPPCGFKPIIHCKTTDMLLLLLLLLLLLEGDSSDCSSSRRHLLLVRCLPGYFWFFYPSGVG